MKRSVTQFVCDAADFKLGLTTLFCESTQSGLALKNCLFSSSSLVNFLCFHYHRSSLGKLIYVEQVSVEQGNC